MLNYRSLFWMLLLWLSSCSQVSESVFSMEGRVENMEDGSILILEDLGTKEILDSAIVKDQSFVFGERQLPGPTLATLRTVNYANRRVVWLENRKMTFEETGSGFKYAVVTGSKTDALNAGLRIAVDAARGEEKNTLVIDFIKENPNSIVSANLLSVSAMRWGREQTAELFEAFSEENKNNAYSQKIRSFIELNKDLHIRDSYADFVMTDTSGLKRRLSDLEGKMVLLEFWASWCGPCRRENPFLMSLYEKYHSEGFEIFAVSLDKDKKSWQRAIREDGLEWIQVSDLQGPFNEASLIYGVTSIPDNFLIDRDGSLIRRGVGTPELAEILAKKL